jgi:hypothetical protein
MRQTEPVLLIVMYSLWPQVTIRTLKVPSCIRLPNWNGDDKDVDWIWRLSSDPSILCWKSEHVTLILISGLACDILAYNDDDNDDTQYSYSIECAQGHMYS